MIKVVYFNQWFSSITDVIRDLKEKHKDEIKVIASSKNPDHVYKTVVDEFIVEDWEETENTTESMINYLNWLLKLCKDKRIDIFFAKKHMDIIAENKFEFASVGTFIVCESKDVLKQLESKSNTYKVLNDTIKSYIPHYLYTSYKESVINLLKDKYEDAEVCFKFDKDEGGASYRAINDNEITIESLHNIRFNCVNTNEAISMVNNTKSNELKNLIFMEQLDGPEISVDCYNSKKGFIAICRKKIMGRKQKIFYNKQISKICEDIGSKLGLMMPYNVQFRVKHNKDSNKIENLRLLEVNPRLSGGVYYEVKAGLNIADACLSDIINRPNYDYNKFINFKDVYVTHVEQAVLLDM